MLQLGDLSVQRDWGYAPKFIEAMWLMLQKGNFNEFLICSGQVTSLEVIVNKVFEKLDLNVGEHIQIEENLMRNLELDIIYGDNTKAKNELGWDYNLSLDDLIATLIEDTKQYLDWEIKNKGA